MYVPIPYHIERHAEKSENELIIAMSYVEESSFADRPLSNSDAVRAVLRWLAAFHASYWGTDKVNDIVESAGLQPQGSYWYLDTRPDEYDAMPRTGWQGRLKRAARAIDSRLKRDPLQCLIHGDVKEANVLYSVDTNAAKTSDITPSLSAVATMATVTMCDFQYCGKGPPTKDLAYFLCSSANVIDEVAAVEYYLEQLTMRLTSDVEVPSLDELQESLDIAFCDFYRFMSGWGFWGSGGEDRVKAVLNRLDGGKDLGSEEFYDEAMKRVYS